MNKKVITAVALGIVLATVCGILILNSPDSLSSIFIGIMSALIVFGFFFGISRAMDYGKALSRARDVIRDARKLTDTNLWDYVVRKDAFFFSDPLDREFVRYRQQVNPQQADHEDIVSDIADVINAEFLEKLTRYALVRQIPNTLTGLGILGTFVGLLQGISGIGITSVDVLVNSFTGLLTSISFAFYTSISGVILSTLFDWMVRYCWDDLLQELFHFHREFHSDVILSTEEQERLQRQAFFERVLVNLDRTEREAAEQYLK